MILDFVPRLICVVLAALFLVFAATSAIVAIFAPRAVRFAHTLLPRTAARLTFALHILPAGLASMVVFGLCLPGYLRFEPEVVAEHVGVFCLSLAAGGLTLLLVGSARATIALVRSIRFLRLCRKTGCEREGLCAVVIESPRPFVALAGIVRPRVMLSRSIADALAPAEMAAVLSHEQAHRRSLDNLKRLCLLLGPGLPALERAWVKFAEYAADEDAVAGDKARAVALAAALVRVARLGPLLNPAPAAIAFVGDAADLTGRVERLLAPRPVAQGAQSALRARTAWPLFLAVSAAGLASYPAMLRNVQEMLEALVR